MTDPHRSISAQDIQKAGKALRTVLENSQPVIELIVHALLARMAFCLQEADERTIDIEAVSVSPPVLTNAEPSVDSRPLRPSNQPVKGEFWPSLR
ncbi:MAG: hypothetical protein OXO48_10945 [Caldilineaceae bacterium]|nr:hypothetical protein [Caldilineaceae bacterium]